MSSTPWSADDKALSVLGILAWVSAALFLVWCLATDGKYLPKAVYKDAADSNRCPPGHR